MKWKDLLANPRLLFGVVVILASIYAIFNLDEFEHLLDRLLLLLVNKALPVLLVLAVFAFVFSWIKKKLF